MPHVLPNCEARTGPILTSRDRPLIPITYKAETISLVMTYEVFFHKQLATVAAALQQANFPMLLCNCFAGRYLSTHCASNASVRIPMGSESADIDSIRFLIALLTAAGGGPSVCVHIRIQHHS